MIFKDSIPILFSTDIDRSIRYYVDVLGFDNHWKYDHPPTFGGVSRNLVEIFFCKDGQGNPGTWISIMLDNVDELYQEIKDKGAVIKAVPGDKEWGLREMLVEDPDGHILRFGSPLLHDRIKGSEFPAGITIVERKPTIEEYQRLVASVGWKVKEESVVKKIIEAGLFAVVAINEKDKTVIGCVLVLGDDSSFYYIKDMMVDKSFQNRKIGTSLMKKVQEWLSLNGESHSIVGLYTGENLSPFYKQFGFRESFGMTYRIGEKILEKNSN